HHRLRRSAGAGEDRAARRAVRGRQAVHVDRAAPRGLGSSQGLAVRGGGRPVRAGRPPPLVVPPALRAIAARLHVAPPPAPVLGGVQEEPAAIITCALTNKG